ncbi:MAG TPA: TIM barrel protein [Terriglobia bacterium]|nr:TIM barrel protein [Terriglobia bacterium]
MNRRSFARKLAGAALGSAAFTRAAQVQGLPEPFPGRADQESGIPFKFSIMLWTVFRQLPFEERLEKVAEAGYHNVELTGEFHNWSDAEYANVNRRKRALGINFDCTSGLRHGIGNPEERQAFLADLRNILPILDRLECPSLIVMSGNRVPGLDRQAQHQSCIEGLKRAAEVVEGKNVRLLLENIDPEENPHYYLTSVAEGFEIMRAVNHPQVQFLYDFYHEQIAEGNLIEKLEKNIDLVGLVHIADVPGRHEPGTGEIDYRNIFKKLAQLNYRHYAAMEYLPTYDAVKSLRATREMATQAARSARA